MKQPDRTLGAIATVEPGAAKVLARHRIDYCCQGHRRFIDACAAAGLDPDAVLDEIRQEPAGEPSSPRWDHAPLSELIEHIVSDHHRPLPNLLLRLQGLAYRVFGVHGDRDPERLIEVRELLEDLRDLLVEHMHKEEALVFPWLLTGNTAAAGALVTLLERDHDEISRFVRELRQLADHFAPPREGCRSMRALAEAMDALEGSLREHMHLENNILLPRALAR